MALPREEFAEHVHSLVALVRPWAEASDWVTKVYPKRICDVDDVIFEMPALYLQRGATKLLLDPIAYDAPDASAAVDLYMMPAYDDAAKFYLEKTGWVVYHRFPTGPATLIGAVRATKMKLTSKALNKILDSIDAHAVTSI